MRGSQTGKNKCICCGVTKNEYFPVRKGGGRNQYFNEITVAGQACALSDHSNLLSAFHKSLRSFVNTREASKRCEIFLLRKITTFFCRFSLLEHRFLTWLSVGGTLHSSPSALKKKIKTNFLLPLHNSSGWQLNRILARFIPLPSLPPFLL